MKIALIGAQGVGKTTLAQKLGGITVPEVARDCPYPIDTAADFRTEWWMVSHAILAEINASRGLERGQLLVADRCALDIAVYSHLVHYQNPRAVTFEQLEMIENTVNNWLSIAKYDHIILLSVSEDRWQVRDLDDGFRSTNLEWYRKLSKGFITATGLIPIHTKVHHITNDGTMDDLLYKVQASINYNF